MNTRSIIYEFAILEHAAYFCVGYIKRCCIKVLLVRSGMNPKRCFISFLSVFLYADVWFRYMEPKITLFPNIKFGAELTLEILKLRTKDLSEPNLICRRSWPSYRTYILRRSNLGRTSIIPVPKFSCRCSPVPNIGWSDSDPIRIIIFAKIKKIPGSFLWRSYRNRTSTKIL